MMLSILLVTILTASGFYVLTGEAEIGTFLTVNSTKSGDWEKVYGEGPYTETSKKNNGQKYYIRYTGEKTGRTTVDLKDAKAKDTKGNLVDTGLKIGTDEYPYIFGQKITSTYKMFSNNDDLYRVFIPSSIAFADTDTSLTAKYKGIQPNTFDGDSQEIDCIYRTPNLGDNINVRGSGLKSAYDKTGISYTNASNVTTYVALDNNNINRNNAVANQTDTYTGKIQNVFVTNEVATLQCMFMKNYFNGKDNLDIPETTEIKAVLLDDNPNKNWSSVYRMFGGQTFTTLPSHFNLPNTATACNTVFGLCENLESLPSGFKIPNSASTIENIFMGCFKLSAKIDIPSTVNNVNGMFMNAGTQTNSKIDNTDCPIVMNYLDTNIPSLAYRTNVKGLENNGKVYKRLYDWEIVFDSKGPYSFNVNDTTKQYYYIHYRGESSIVDLGESDTNNKLTVNSGTTKIFGIEVTNTYKMFAKNNSYDNNDKLCRVFIPSSIAFNTDTNGGIQKNTFDGDSQVIDCIYRTPNLGSNINETGSGLKSTYDKTGITFDNASNVTTYVYLGSENMSNRTNPDSTAYGGQIEHVYVGKEITVTKHLFDKDKGATDVSRALIDGITNENADLSYMFRYQTTLELTETFKMPEKCGTDLSYMFYYCSGFTSLPSSFRIPDGVKNITHFLDICDKLESLPEEFTIPNSVETMDWAFASLRKLSGLPSKFSISTNAKSMVGMFAYDTILSATITVPKDVKDISRLFDNDTGRYATETIGNTGCPIVMEYSDTNIPSLNYRTNVKNLNATGYVYKKLYDWEVVYASDGPYSFKVNDTTTQNYYIHYRGNTSTVDLGVANTNNKLTVNNGTTRIFGIEVTNTYMMFAKNDAYDSNDKLYRVFIPSSIAFNTSTNGGIQKNTFDGDSQVIDCIYRTPKLRTIDARGTGLSEKNSSGKLIYDKTSISYTNASNVTTYVSLDSNNINRTDSSSSYKGSIANVYIDKIVGNVEHMFNIAWNGYTDGTPLNNALMDEDGEWTRLGWMFRGQTLKTLPSHFKFNKSATDLEALFGYGSGIIELPEGFKLPDNAVNIKNMFADCHLLKKVPDSFKITSKVTTALGLFFQCYELSDFPSQFVIPNGVTDCTGMFDGDTYLSTTVTIPKSVTSVGNNMFTNAGTQSTKKITYDGKKYSIVVKCANQSIYNAITEVDGVLHKVLDTSIQSSSDQSQPVVVSDEVDNTDSVQDSTDVNDNTTDNSSDSSEKIVIEDETDWVIITVNKKSVDEIVDETQETSQSTENVETESKEEETTDGQ